MSSPLRRTEDDERLGRGRYIALQMRPDGTLINPIGQGNLRDRILSALRSARAAAVESLLGSEAAFNFCGLGSSSRFKVTPGQGLLGELKDQIERVKNISRIAEMYGKTRRDKIINGIAHDLHLLELILEEIKSISNERETFKSNEIAKFLESGDCVLAFDERVVTLALLEQALRSLGHQVVLATGKALTHDRHALASLDRTAQGAPIAVLSGPALEESVNLQRARVLMNLTLPSTVRMATQRVGRVDRFDSPHRTIDIVTFLEPPALRLRRDARFGKRLEEADAFLGLEPGVWTRSVEGGSGEPRIYDEEALAAVRVDIENESAIESPLTAIRGLKDGSKALVRGAVYNAFRDVTARLGARIAIVASRRPFAFIALRGKIGADVRSPSWLWLERGGAPIVDVVEIVSRLRRELQDCDLTMPLSPNESTVREIEAFSEELRRHAPDLLPLRYRRALDLLRKSLRLSCGEGEEGKRASRMLDALNASPEPEQDILDHEAVAEAWLEATSSQRQAAMAKYTEPRPFTIEVLLADLFYRPPEGALDLVEEAMMRSVPPIGRLCAAFLVGTPAVRSGPPRPA